MCCVVFFFVLVGIVSKTFSLNGNEDFVLKSGISLKYYTPTAVKQYIQDLTFCGSCYRALNVFITSNEYKKRGYIFAVSFLFQQTLASSFVKNIFRNYVRV